MISLVRCLSLLPVAALFGSAVARPPTPEPALACMSDATRDSSKLQQCLETVIFAIEAVSNASGDFSQACRNINPDQADEQALDALFLRYLICGRFNGKGIFYNDVEDATADLELTTYALNLAETRPTSALLRIWCPTLNLQLIYDFGLPAGQIYYAACGGIYVESPPQYSSSASSVTSAYSTQSSSYSVTSGGPSQYTVTLSPPTTYNPPTSDGSSPTMYQSSDYTGSSSWSLSSSTSPGSPPSMYTGYSLSSISDPLTPSPYLPGWNNPSTTTNSLTTSFSTSSITPPPSRFPTTSASSASKPCTTDRAISKRQDNTNGNFDYWVNLLRSALLALDYVETNQTASKCDRSGFWVFTFNNWGFDGEYVESIICSYAAGNDLFPGSTIIEVRATLINAMDGLLYAQSNTDPEARIIACRSLSFSILSQAGLNATEIIQLVCPSTSSSSSSSVSSSTSSTSSSGSSVSTSTIVSTSTTTVSTSSSSSSSSSTTGSTSSSTSTGSTASSTSSTSGNSSSSTASSTSSSSSSSTTSSGSTTSSTSSTTSTVSFPSSSSSTFALTTTTTPSSSSCSSTTLNTSYLPTYVPTPY